jgi:serine/threonine protein kinase
MPDSSADRDPLDVLAEEFVNRYRAGQRPRLSEFILRQPDRADEIRELFPALVEMEQLKPVSGDRTGDFAPVAEPTDPLRVGEFRILRRVGHGGMGVVYEAVQESLGRHVALKLMPLDALADPKRLERCTTRTSSPSSAPARPTAGTSTPCSSSTATRSTPSSTRCGG